MYFLDYCPTFPSSVSTSEIALRRWEKAHESVTEMGRQHVSELASLVRLVVNFGGFLHLSKKQ